MTRTTVTRVFIGGMLAVLTGAVVAVAATWVAIANDVFVMNGPDIVGLHGSALAWVLIGVGIAGGLAMLAGMAGGVVAWIGALLNTSRLPSRAWFLVLLVAGIFSFGFVAMVAYVLAGPEGTTGTAAPRTPIRPEATPA